MLRPGDTFGRLFGRPGRKLAIALALTTFAVATSLAIAATGRERSLAVYPPQIIPIKFDVKGHATHLKEGADCLTCHDTARKSVKAADNLLPGHSAPGKHHADCESCHDIEKAAQGKKVDPPSACADCHVGFDETVRKEPPKVVFPQPNLIFDHKVHVDKKIRCESCHGEMKDLELATRQQLPKMETCLVCHEGTFASAACATCHRVTPSGRLQVSFASGIMRPTQGNPFGMDHGPRFELTHGTRAALERNACMDCHAENECQFCHDSLQKPLAVHPNDYITTHPVQARMDSTRCDSCHRMQSFCTACHERVGVSMDADRGLKARNLKVHNDYTSWVDAPAPGVSTLGHHAVVASRDIKQCMACHREESCISCHATSAVPTASRFVNPHPAGFDKACKALAAKNDRACLKCHSNSDLQARGCR